MFPIAAVTYFHGLSSLKQHKLVSHNSGGQKSEMNLTGLKFKSQQGYVSSGGGS